MEDFVLNEKQSNHSVLESVQVSLQQQEASYATLRNEVQLLHVRGQ